MFIKKTTDKYETTLETARRPDCKRELPHHEVLIRHLAQQALDAGHRPDYSPRVSPVSMRGSPVSSESPPPLTADEVHKSGIQIFRFIKEARAHKQYKTLKELHLQLARDPNWVKQFPLQIVEFFRAEGNYELLLHIYPQLLNSVGQMPTPGFIHLIKVCEKLKHHPRVSELYEAFDEIWKRALDRPTQNAIDLGHRLETAFFLVRNGDGDTALSILEETEKLLQSPPKKHVRPIDDYRAFQLKALCAKAAGKKTVSAPETEAAAKNPAVQMTLGLCLDYCGGEKDEARSALYRAVELIKDTDHHSMWAIANEAIKFDIRHGDFADAAMLCQQMMRSFPEVGNLRVLQIYLGYALKQSPKVLWEMVQEGLKKIPKAGELYRERARMQMNPADAEHYNLESAEKDLEMALKLTPQAGDSYLELARLYMMQKRVGHLATLRERCLHHAPTYGVEWESCHVSVVDSPAEVFDRAVKLLAERDFSRGHHLSALGRISGVELLKAMNYNFQLFFTDAEYLTKILNNHFLNKM